MSVTSQWSWREPRSKLDTVNDLTRLYTLLSRLREQQGGYRHLRDCTARTGWPARGVYFFFEPGEFRADGESLRVVRVGTHALTGGSKVTLWQRLQMHKGTPDGGSHHRSVFRLHVGAALLARGGFPPEIGKTWGRGNSSGSDEARAIERPLERAVSTYIGAMPFLVLTADDEPGPASVRGYIERNTIGLLSSVGLETDPPSPGWLGRDCPHPVVRASGLWNVNHVGEAYEPAFLDRLEALVEASESLYD
ncbi:MAG: hypothetical protein ABFC89_13045 [Methanospirillum sp.]